MTFKSPFQPFCRNCGKPIPKETGTHFLTNGPVEARPRTKAECEALTNHRVVSVTYDRFTTPKTIWKFTVWDGESYAAEYFCTVRCGELFGLNMARKGWHTAAYAAAIKGRVV